jgi:hypothetical protein|tara:strand:+ start:118 stop:348 length:231 start_codon:yes stop_codon:yes gene_type:complete
MTLENYAKQRVGRKNFLHSNPDALKELKKLMIEADDLNLSDTQLAIYVVKNFDQLKHKSHNTVRRWFSEIRLGLYD